MNEIASPDHNNKQGNFWLVMVVLIGTFLVSYCSSHQDLPKVFETPEAIPTVTTSRAPVVPVVINSTKVEKVVDSNGPITFSFSPAELQISVAASNKQSEYLRQVKARIEEKTNQVAQPQKTE